MASFAHLDELTREKREALEEMKHLLGTPAAAGSFPSGTELADVDKLGELDSLVKMAKTLGEVAVSACRSFLPDLKEGLRTRQSNPRSPALVSWHSRKVAGTKAVAG